MEYNKKNNKNIIYMVIGVLTLIIAVSGATYAYFTATADNADAIKGNMATIDFGVEVTKVTNADNTTGLIPMSNSMVESALTKNAGTGKPGVCVDDNGNVVCQVYKITTTNNGPNGVFIDGYVTLAGGSGTPTDSPDVYRDVVKDADGNVTSRELVESNIKNSTTMRWAQAFCEETGGVATSCTTEGKTTTAATKSDNGVASGITSVWGKVQNTLTTEDDKGELSGVKYDYGKTGFNTRQILTSGITTKAIVSRSEYDVINTNYIRVSNHDSSKGYTRADDVTSALVYNEFLEAINATANPTGGSSSTYTDSQVFYIVVWLSETGTNQTVDSADDRLNFFSGVVKFISAEGNEVSATFTDYTRIEKTS